MKKNRIVKEYGIWIDQQRAIVVLLQDDDNIVKEIRSGVKAYAPDEEMKKFFEAVTEKVTGASMIFIFGPSEARFGLEKQIRRHKDLQDVPITVAPADAMPQVQVVKAVKKFYANQIVPENVHMEKIRL